MNFINKKILNTPFPLLISDISNDFLNKENESTICDEILELKQEKETEMVMGGRYRYLKIFLKKIYVDKFLIISINKVLLIICLMKFIRLLINLN